MQYKSNVIKIILYFAILSFGMSLTMTSITSCELFILGAVLGPALSLSLLKRKGLYSVCILLIFLAELSVFAARLWENALFSNLLSNIAIGMSITSTLFMCPIVTHYLKGPIPFAQIFPAVIITLFSGLIIANPILSIYSTLAASRGFTIAILLLLACNFLTVLSIWKHRLVLLK